MSKKQPKLTEWYPGDVDPIREGVYEVEWLTDRPVFARFTDAGPSGWTEGTHRDKEKAGRLGPRIDWGNRPLRWRGLAVKP